MCVVQFSSNRSRVVSRLSRFSLLDDKVSHCGPGRLLHVVKRRVLLGTAREAAGEHALQGVLERFTEVAVEVGVDQRVERRVEVADPEEDGDDDVGAVAGVAAQRRDHVPENERCNMSETSQQTSTGH